MSPQHEGLMDIDNEARNFVAINPVERLDDSAEEIAKHLYGIRIVLESIEERLR